MKISLISFEYPTNNISGGIGTYIAQIAIALSQLGHHIEVFTSTDSKSKTVDTCGYLVHFIYETNKNNFKNSVLAPFEERHKKVLFDAVECAEFGADALIVKQRFPELPLTVKLHTPSWLIDKLNDTITWPHKVRFLFSGLLRGKINKRFWIYRKELDEEYYITTLANAVYSPSTSLANLVADFWDIPLPMIVPNPFKPSSEILKLPVRAIKKSNPTITFIGRLENRKGVVELAKAIPLIIKGWPDVQFHFVGAPHTVKTGRKMLSMDNYIKRIVGKKYDNKLIFFGRQPQEKLPELLSAADICIFPSRWENFPNVCLEAMAAGKIVVGTDNGGMAEMIENKKSGFLIPANSPTAIAKAILRLNKYDSDELMKMQLLARNTVIENFNETRIGKMTEQVFQNAIKNA